MLSSPFIALFMLSNLFIALFMLFNLFIALFMLSSPFIVLFILSSPFIALFMFFKFVCHFIYVHYTLVDIMLLLFPFSVYLGMTISSGFGGLYKPSMRS
jgi:hypothetical protein